jgi:hypothetical protein
MTGHLPLPNYNKSCNSTTTSITFTHANGLPQKNGQTFPLFDYEQLLYNELQQHKHIWIKKATGLGITEFMLRYICWLCLKDDTYKHAQIPLSADLIKTLQSNLSNASKDCLNP